MSHKHEDELRAWLRAYGQIQPGQQSQEQVFKELIYLIEEAIERYGYEAVYFGVGCEVFPDAVDPGWDGQY